MNDFAHDRDRFDRLISGLAEVKAEVVALGARLTAINGSLLRHFEEDRKWMTTHEREHNQQRVETALSAGQQRGIMLSVGVAASIVAAVSTVAVNLLLG